MGCSSQEFALLGAVAAGAPPQRRGDEWAGLTASGSTAANTREALISLSLGGGGMSRGGHLDLIDTKIQGCNVGCPRHKCCYI